MTDVTATPDWYTEWRATLDFDEIDFGAGGIHLEKPDEVLQAQVGYAVNGDGKSLVGVRDGDWRPEWVVIGRETACGDPIFASQKESHPVFWAMHGAGSWRPKLIAPSLSLFGDCLEIFREFARDRGNSLLDINPLTEQAQAAFLRSIKQLIGADRQTLDFWAVQIEVDLEGDISRLI